MAKTAKITTPKSPPRFTARRQEGGGGTRTWRPPRCWVVFAFGLVPSRFGLSFLSGAAAASSGGSSSSFPSESTQTVSYSCRRSFSARRRCFLVGMEG